MHGFTVRRGLFRGPMLAALRRAVAELEALPEAPGRVMKYFDAVEGAPAGRLLNRIENFAPYHPALAALLHGPELLGGAAALLGEPAVLFKDKINLKLPGGGGFEPHQDAQAGWDEYASLFVTAAVAIDAASPENGCLELARWPHQRVLIGPLWQPLEPAALAGMCFEPLPMRPGDAVFFDSYLPHRSGPNPTASPRRVLYVTYNRAAEGDHRSRYFAAKRASYPPDCERLPGRSYAYRV
jgi:hypothetical protein